MKMTNCYICGESCQLCSNNRTNCCSNCAGKIHLLKYGRIDSQLLNGDAFPDSWKHDIESIKTANISEIKSRLNDRRLLLNDLVLVNINGLIKSYQYLYYDRGYFYLNDLESNIVEKFSTNTIGNIITKIIGNSEKINMKQKDFIVGTIVTCVHSGNSSFIGKQAKIVSYSPGDIVVEWLDGSKNNTNFALNSSFELFKQPPAYDKLKTVDFDCLESGDRVKLIIPESSSSKERTVIGTFLYYDESFDEVCFHLDDIINDEEMCGLYFSDLQSNHKINYQKYDDGEQNFWTVSLDQINDASNIDELEFGGDRLFITEIIQSKNKKEEKQKIMSNDKLDFKKILTQDASKAAIRSGATLGINGLKAGLQKILASEGVDAPGAKAIMKFFDSPIGEAMLRAGLGYGLLSMPIPMIQENQYAQNLSEELRVSGMAKGMDKGVELLQQFIVPALLESFQGTPLLENLMAGNDTAKHRVAEHIAPKRVSDHQIHSEDDEIEVSSDEPKAIRASV